MTKERDIIICGYPSIDHMIKLDSTPKIGATSTIVEESTDERLFGGCSVNIAYAMSALGLYCGLSMIVGRDFEASGFKNFLEEKGINLDDVLVNKNLSTSHTYLIANHENEQITLFYPGPMASSFEKTYEAPQVEGRSLLITIGNLYRNKQILLTAAKKQIPVYFSMKGDLASLDKEYLQEVFETSEVIFMNEAEKKLLDEILGQNVLTAIGRNNLKVIVVTKGAEGSVSYFGNGQVAVPIVPCSKIVDTTGCGDAYIAGFLYRYINGDPLNDCMISGSVMSSFVIEKFGCLTNVPTKEDFIKREDYFRNLLNDEKRR